MAYDVGAILFLIALRRAPLRVVADLLLFLLILFYHYHFICCFFIKWDLWDFIFVVVL